MGNPRTNKSWRTVLAFLGSILGISFCVVFVSAARGRQTPGQSTDTTIIRRVSLVANDLIVDPTTQTIYASVPGEAGPFGNSLTRVDPINATIGTSTYVGSDPNRLAMSDNRQYIYIGLNGEASVRRFDIASQTAQLKFYLGSVPGKGPLLAQDIDVMPGQPQTIAITRSYLGRSPSHDSVVIYDNDVPRPVATKRIQDFDAVGDLEFSASPLILYGQGFGDGNSFRKLSVNSQGVSYSGSPSSIGDLGPIEFNGGLIYHPSGKVRDPEQNLIVGTYPGLNFGRGVVVDTPNNRVYFITGGGNFQGHQTFARVHAFNKTTFELIGSYLVPVTGPVHSLVQWGNNGLAFCDDNSVILVPVPSAQAPPDPTPTPTPTPVPTPGVGELRQIPFAANRLLVRPNPETLYATTPTSAGAQGDKLTILDPASGAIGSAVDVGANPNQMGITSNGQFMYIGLDGEQAVRKVDLTTLTAGQKFPITFNASVVAPLPGSTDTIAVLREPQSPELLIYDSGVPRPVTKVGSVSNMAFSNSPDVLYVQGQEDFTDFAKLGIESCGVGLSAQRESLFFQASPEIQYDNGMVYTSLGQVIEAEKMRWAGVFRAPFSTIRTDSKTNKLYALLFDQSQIGGPVTTLKVYSLDKLALQGSLRIPGVTSTPGSLVRYGINGLAFNTTNQVFFLENALIGGATVPVIPAPTASPATFTAVGRVDEGSTGLSGVTINYTGVRTGTTQTDIAGRYAVPDLPLCGALTVTPSKPNYIFSPASITLTNLSGGQLFSATHRVAGFSQSQITVNESANSVLLPFSITAQIPPGSEIAYSTADGTASDRSDYTASNFVFHSGSQAQMRILITDDALVEGPETFTVTLAPIPGFDVVNPTLTITITDNDTVPPVDSPLQTAQFFVRRQYHDFLNREPDSAGLNFWTGQITACNSIADPQQKADCFEERHVNVSAAFFFSIEFQSTGYLVHRLYTASFPESGLRPRGLPRLSEFLHDTTDIGGGVVVGQGNWSQLLEQNIQAFIRRWVDRSDFRAQFPDSLTADQFVDGLFTNSGVTPTSAERAAAIAAYGAGGQDARALALRSVVESRSIYNKQYNSAFVLMQYFGYLRRNPNDVPDLDYSGYDFWLQKLNDFTLPGEDPSSDSDIGIQRARRAEMVKAFLVSSEYMTRFGPTNFNIRQ